MSLIDIPRQLSTHIFKFLTAKECNRLAATCRDFYQYYHIGCRKVTENYLQQDLQEADLLYCEVPIHKTIQSLGFRFNLEAIEFRFQTRDQGWVNDLESRSWIEAEFDTSDQSEEGVGTIDDCGITAAPRLPLVWNYEVKHYQQKTKWLEVGMLKESIRAIKIFLRSMGARNTVSCRAASIRLLYGPATAVISERQLPKPQPPKGKKRIIGV